MGDIAIRVEGLSKKYRIGGPATKYRTIRESITGAAAAPFIRARDVLRGRPPGQSSRQAEIWALKDVSFDVKRGEVVGIIGRNGAGKSTLLKILSRITKPTAGEADVYGRVGSLLEVGTGFHPELTGRENIYLSGAILGMKRAEIDRKFDEIVAFAEVPQFIDTAVKHYSSGMYLRLAFGVAANLEPEILLVDEVLAVGDADFQKKCLGKMGDVAREGRTVFFVSHNIGAIVSLTERCLLVENGRIIEDGDPTKVTESYQSSIYKFLSNKNDLTEAERYGTGRARFMSIDITYIDSLGKEQPFFKTGMDIKVKLMIESFSTIGGVTVGLTVYDSLGLRLIDANNTMINRMLNLMPESKICTEFQLFDVLLKPGTYYLGLWLGRSGEDIDGILHAAAVPVESNTDEIEGTQIFPGLYQCRFSLNVSE